MDLVYLAWWLVAIALVLIGLAGAVLPALPGIPFVFGGLLVAAWADQFARVGTFTLVVLGILGAVGLALDFIAGSLGAKKVGASPQAVAGATFGAFIGIFFGLPGLILGPFVGAVVGELQAQRSLGQAAASGVGTWIGLFLGIVAKLVIGIVMIAIFAFDYFVQLG
ncbi:MAG TPA: DUF456 family protein [Nevskiaceae bacterium]|nr:DUF456 family protein [Nevskiaceae bacterium]